MWDIFGKAVFFYVLSRFGWSCLKGLYGSFLASVLGLNLNVKKLGKWSVVTGATDGIGKAYAFELARQGQNIVLISRSPFKLQNVASEISTQYKVETKIIDVDFTSMDIYDRIKRELGGLEIGVLINNVGMGLEHPEYFQNIDDSVDTNLIFCNLMSVTKMTKIVLGGMLERRRGLIVNVSSLSSLIPAPLLAVYGATKAYVVSFSKSLELETRAKGVTVQCITPGFVVTNLSKIRRASLMIPTPKSYVKTSMKGVGIEAITGGYYMHKLQIYAIETVDKYLPGFLVPSVTYSQLASLRSRALKKKEREAKSQ